jgi:hypothetical protein
MTVTEQLSRCWSRSKWFRFGLVVAVAWVILRLVFQFIYAAGLFPELTGGAGVPMDLPVYVRGGENFQLRQDLYPQDLSDSTYHYPYPPPFAMLSMVLLWLPVRWSSILGTLLTVAAYALMYLRWGAIFQRLQLENVNEKLAWTLPVWLVFSAFWGDLSFLNVGVIVALVTTLLIEALLEEHLGWATFWLTLLLLSKIMWAFPVALPLLMGRRRFFFQLLALTGAAYLAAVGFSALVAGPGYILQQYMGYFEHLKRISNEFPWHVWSAATPFLGYNHSIKQIFVFVLGDTAWVKTLATAIKLIVLLPLGILSVKLLLRPARISKMETVPFLFLDLAFALYLGAFIWLDIVWEALFGMVIFSYLLATVEQRWIKIVAWVVFLPYALVDVIQLVSYLIGGDSVIDMHGGYVLTDPSLYLPLIMLVILVFYGILVRRLWNSPSAWKTTAAV